MIAELSLIIRKLVGTIQISPILLEAFVSQAITVKQDLLAPDHVMLGHHAPVQV